MCFVLNRASQLAGLSFDDIAELLGSRAILQIPTGGPELSQAINAGRPVVVHQTKSPVVRAIHALADHVASRVAGPVERH
jgi:MinD-like ATPase involved in chromosome partitioning or flagellar assembly